jgi:hypothetical protein
MKPKTTQNLFCRNMYFAGALYGMMETRNIQKEVLIKKVNMIIFKKKLTFSSLKNLLKAMLSLEHKTQKKLAGT